MFPALMTEFKEDESLDLEATARHIDACLSAGIEGLVMLGTLGENSSLAPDEKEAVMRCAVETVAGRVPVLTGIAEYTTDLAIETVRRAERAGCDGLMALPCLVYEQDQREALAHFRAVAQASRFTLDDLRGHFALLADAEAELRTPVPQEVVIEALIPKLTGDLDG